MASTYELIIKAVDQTSRPTRKIEQNLKKLERSGNRVNKTLKAAGGALAAFATGATIRSIVKTTARFEDLQDTLVSVTGSAEAGAQAFKGISKFATQTQFGIEDLTTTYIKLAGAGIKPTTKLLTTFTDTAAVTTDQIGTLQAITDLFSRTTAGGLGLEELNRLADRGVPVFAILQEQLGLTRLEISEFGKTAEGAGKITEALTKGLNERFGGATLGKVDNLSTAMSNFGIQIAIAANTLGTQMRPQLTGAINEATAYLAKNEELIKALGGGLGQAIEMSAKALGVLAQNIDVIRNAILTGIAIAGARSFVTLLGKINQVTAGAKSLTGFLSGMTKGLKNLAVGIPIVGRLAALFSGPVGIAILGAVTAATYFKDSIVTIGETTASLGEVFGAVMSLIGKGVQTAASYLGDTFLNAVTVVSDSFDTYIRQPFGRVMEAVGKIVKSALNFVINTYIAAFESIKQIVYQLPQFFVNVFKAIINMASEFGNAVTEKFANIGSAISKALEGDFTGAMADLGKESAYSFSESFRNSFKDVSIKPNVDMDAIYATDTLGNAYDFVAGKAEALRLTVSQYAAETMGPVVGAIEAEIQSRRAQAEVLDDINTTLPELNDNLDEVVINTNEVTDATTNATAATTALDNAASRVIENLVRENKELGELKAALANVGELAKMAGVNETKLTEALQKQIDVIEGNTTQLEQRAEKVKTFAEEINEKIASASDTLASDMARSLAQGKSVLGDFKNFFNRILDDILQAVIEKNITQPLVNQLSGLMGGMGGGGGLGGMLGGLFGGGGGFSFGSIFSGIGSFFGFANGGYPPIGQPSVVGENGPEVIVPGRSSTVMPIDAGGGGGTVVNFNINAVDTQTGVEFLLENKPTIVAMIQQASNKRGKVGILD